MPRLSVAVLVALTAFLTASCAQAQPVAEVEPGRPDPPAPSPLEGLEYDAPFFPGATYDDAIPTVESLIGITAGERAATHAEIERCFQAWADASERTRLVEYARTYEGRPLYYMIISSPENMDRIDEIQRDLQRLADPRQVSEAEGDRLARTLPAVAWMAYSIHGDETSGADAALALAQHLTAGTNDEVTRMLDDLVVIIDPMMNPDGRDRFLQMIAEHRGASPDVDNQSLVHEGYWPWGRTNHYLFDLNRDWIFGVHPESRGRIRASGRWHPLLFVDCHEMGSQDTYLFSPSRAPVNPFLPESRLEWWDVFARDQAAAFDAFGWRYYTGEWNEEWYPGYSSSWAGFRGAVGILYEQAGVAEDGVKRPEDRIMTYREAVHHQAVSSVANLRTLQANRDALLRSFVEERRRAVSAEGSVEPRVWVIPPTANAWRLREFASLLNLQGVEVFEATRAFEMQDVVDRLGREEPSRRFPAGSLVISTRQPEAPLTSALLRFDPQMPADFLQDERRELLRFGDSKLYDVTGWNLTMMHDLEAYEASGATPGGAKRYEPAARLGGAGRGDRPTAYVIDGRDDASVAAAARLLERGAQVRVADRAFRFDEMDFPRGSVVLTRSDNQGFDQGLIDSLDTVCEDLGVTAQPVGSGLSPAVDVPDLGGEHFVLLARPRIAILWRGTLSMYNAGEAWFNVDQRLGVRASLVNVDGFERQDLRRYNVIILPEAWGEALDAGQIEALRSWVREGGTLIATGPSARALAREDGLSEVRVISDVLEDLDEYELAVLREWEGRTADVDVEDVWRHDASADVTYPWGEIDEARPALEELERRDEWQSLFMPQGALLAGRVDDRHWLTFGAGEYVPIVYGRAPVLMARGGVDAPVRMGVFTEAARSGEEDEGGDAAAAGPQRIGWAAAPEGHELRLRMSGLLWPEAAQRVANSAYLTRERVGRGQVILFATSPTFRGAALGTTRLFLNAVVFGPGFAGAHVIEP